MCTVIKLVVNGNCVSSTTAKIDVKVKDTYSDPLEVEVHFTLNNKICKLRDIMSCCQNQKVGSVICHPIWSKQRKLF